MRDELLVGGCEMTGSTLLLFGSAIFVALIFCRLFGGTQENVQGNCTKSGICQTTGNQVLQADRAQVLNTNAGTLAVLADGIGKENTGVVCAQIAVDTLLDQFEPYQGLNSPDYFFKSCFYEANKRIQRTIGERRGGACMGAVFTDGNYLHYAVAGDIRIALFRGDELIPLSKGQTLDVLAVQAYEEGKISRQDAIWSMDEKRIWNYLGQDGFHEIEICKIPVRLKQGDKVLLISKGIFEVLSWREMEDILAESVPVQELADKIVMEAEQKKGIDKENGSVILLQEMEA